MTSNSTPLQLRALSELYQTPIEIIQASGAGLVIGEHINQKDPVVLTLVIMLMLVLFWSYECFNDRTNRVSVCLRDLVFVLIFRDTMG